MFTPSKYQKAIFEFVKNGKGNAVINAVAGSGKTTTIVQSLEMVPANAITYFLAFNKAIVEELKKRVPNTVNVSTLHSVGAKAVWAYQKSQLNDKKAWGIMDTLKFDWTDSQGKYPDNDYLGRVKKLVDLYRINLVQDVEELFELAKKHGVEVLNGECDRAVQTVRAMMANKREHDFTDMLYIAAVTEAPLPKADFIFVDECQDLNKAQQMILKKMMKPTSRFIAVGDPRQAIYGFAGADVQSFENLKAMPNTIELALSVNYRCGTEIVKLAQKITPQLEAHEGAPTGTVDFKANLSMVEDGDMVLCRVNDPLVSACLSFIKDKRKAYVRGGDIGKTLINMVKKSKAKDIVQFEVYMTKQLESILTRLGKKYPYLDAGDLMEEPQYVSMADKKAVFEAIIDSEQLQSPDELIKWIELIFADDREGICFSSIHKSKGLENERVFIMCPEKLPHPMAKKAWQKEQEMNLEYVAYTRAKTYLGIIPTESKPSPTKEPK